MSQINTLVNCPELQTELNDLFTCDPTLITEPLVLQAFLRSPANLGGTRMQQMLSPGGGKSRIVEVVYSPRLDEGNVQVDTGRDDCTNENVIGETSTTYDVGNSYVQQPLVIKPFELRYKCEENTRYMAKKIQQAINVLSRKRETVLFEQLALMNGNFAVGEPNVTAKVKTVQTRDADGKFSTDMFTEIGTASRYASYCGNPIVIGGRNVGKYMREVSAGCCSMDGINVADLAAQYGMGFIESYRADDSFGDDNFFTVAPGAIQIIDWLEYEGPEGINYIDTGIYKQMVLVDPFTGYKYDVKINVDCNGNHNIFIRSYFKLISLPTDVFYSTDRLAGVNFINQYAIDNA